MRIAIVGVPGLGVDRVKKMFLKKWNMYEHVKFDSPEETENLELDTINLCNQMKDIIVEKGKSADVNILYDTLPLEYVLYALRFNQAGEFSDESIHLLLEISNEVLNHIDAVFIIPKSQYNAIEEVDIDANLMNDIGAFYDNIIHAYGYGTPCMFFNPNNCPGFIDIFGSDEQKMQLFSFYLKDDGSLQDDNLQKLLSPDQLKEGEEMLKSAIKEQKQATKKDAFYKQLKQYRY